MADVHYDMNSLADFGNGFAFESSSGFSWADLSAPTFTAVNQASAASSVQTVSPKDLFQDPLTSAPASAALTHLTTPDINASPFDSSYETSPMFDPMTGESEYWPSLFPDALNDKPAAPEPIQRTISDQSIGKSSSSSNSPLTLAANHVRQSSRSSPYTTPLNRHSSLSGVSKPRRKKELKDIVLDPHDKVACKRARNTLAARESRQRKVEHVGQLEETIRDLEAERGEILARNEALEAEANKWKQLAMSLGYTGPSI